MKNFILFLLVFFSFSFVFSTVYAENTIVYESEKKYSFDLPQEWEETPNSVVEDYSVYLSEEYEMEVPEYSSGFHLKSKDYFEYPYILVQEFERNGLTFKDLKEIFEEQGSMLVAVKELEEIGISNIDLGEALIDEENYAIFMILESDTPTGRMRALGSVFLGNDWLVHVFFYSNIDDYEKHLPVFNGIVSSFKFDKGYSYDLQVQVEKLQDAEETLEILEDMQEEKRWINQPIYQYIIFGLVLVALVVFAGKDFFKKK